MHKAASRKIGIFLTGLIFLAGAAILSPSLCSAGMHELSEGEMAAVNGSGFSSFTLDNSGLATLNFPGIYLSTYTQIDSLKMGYYNNGSGLGWDQDWQDKVPPGTGKNSFGASGNGNDLTFNGIYIQAKFENVDLPSRQLDYVKIGTTNLSGDISGYFNKLSSTFDSLTGTVYKDGSLMTYSGVPATFSRNMVSVSSGSSPSLTTITANNTGFYLCLDRTGTSNPLGYSLHWDTATIH